MAGPREVRGSRAHTHGIIMVMEPAMRGSQRVHGKEKWQSDPWEHMTSSAGLVLGYALIKHYVVSGLYKYGYLYVRRLFS